MTCRRSARASGKSKLPGWNFRRLLTQLLCGPSAARLSCVMSSTMPLERLVLERTGGMLLRMQEGTRIENPRNYEGNAVENLRILLANGAEAQRDPRRKYFYQLEDNNNGYFIHISPITGNVVLLAKWVHQPQNDYVDSGSLVA